MWLLMPFEHAEDLDAQRRGLALFGAMGLSEMVYYAQVHVDIIARFGRFPLAIPFLAANRLKKNSPFSRRAALPDSVGFRCAPVVPLAFC